LDIQRNRIWEGLPVVMKMASRKDPGLLKKMKSLSNTSRNMAMEVGEPSLSLQVLANYKPTSLSLSLSLLSLGFFSFPFLLACRS
jgi:hypothetical protein